MFSSPFVVFLFNAVFADLSLCCFSRYKNGPPPTLTEAKLAEALEMVTSSAIDLAVARERVRWLEEQVKELKEERNEERRKGEKAAAEERKRAEDRMRDLFDRRFFAAKTNEARGQGADSKRSVSG